MTERKSSSWTEMSDRCVAANCHGFLNLLKVNLCISYLSLEILDRGDETTKEMDWFRERKTGEDCHHAMVKPDYYVLPYTLVPALKKASVPRLKHDKIVVVVFPTVFAIDVHVDTSLPQSERTKRKVRIFLCVKWGWNTLKCYHMIVRFMFFCSLKILRDAVPQR